MPTYDYRCPKCDLVSPFFHSMSESPTYTCSCGETMRKLLGSPVAIKKGDGWCLTTDEYKARKGS